MDRKFDVVPAQWFYILNILSLTISFTSLMTSSLFMICAFVIHFAMCEGIQQKDNATLKMVFCSNDQYLKIISESLAVLTMLDAVEVLITLYFILHTIRIMKKSLTKQMVIVSALVLVYCSVGAIYILVKTNSNMNLMLLIMSILSLASIGTIYSSICFRDQLLKFYKQHSLIVKSHVTVKVEDIKIAEHIENKNIIKKENAASNVINV